MSFLSIYYIYEAYNYILHLEEGKIMITTDTKVKCYNHGGVIVAEITKNANSKVLCILTTEIENGYKNRILVCKPDLLVYNNEIFIPLIKAKHRSTAYREWCYIVGKLCTKDISSRYFENIRIGDHCVHGNLVHSVEYNKAFNTIKESLDAIGYELPAIPSKK